MSEVRLVAEERTEFGKGAARRTRRAGKIPAVLYGHGTDPKHVSLPGLEFARVIREQGRNAVLSLQIGSAGDELALTKTVTTHPLKNYIEHVDLLVVKRGEKVVVDVPVHIVGSPVSGALIQQDASSLSVAADAMNIPEQFEVSIDDLAVGTQVLAGQVELPEGVELQSDPETLVVNVVTAPTAEDMEAEIDTEGAGVVEDAPESEDAGESEASAEGESSDKE